MSSQGECNICNKQIKEGEEYINIGYDKKGNYLKRHKKCHPGLPKYMKVRKSRILEKRHYIKRSDKLYNRDKVKRQFKKDLSSEQYE
jgi:hypothetical protein